MKVFELSKELNIENKDLLDALQKLGIVAKSHMSVISDEDAQKVRELLAGVTTENIPTESINTIIKTEWKADLQRQICIKNISKGKLIYKSKRILGYMLTWDNTGSTNYMELGEFINLKNSDLRFIKEPWIRIIEDDEIEILKYANIYQYYKEMIEVNDIEDLFAYDFEKFQRKFSKLPEGYKKTVAEYAAKMINEGRLDSIKIKNYLEKEMELDLDFLIPTESNTKKNNIIDIK